MNIESDFHSHIVRSSAGQMIQQAQEKGLRVLGLSEHIFQMNEARPLLPYMPQEGPFLTLDAYFTAISTTAEQRQFDARIGLEVDFVPDKFAEITHVLVERPWDFLIGSVHEIDGQLIEKQYKRTQAEGEALWLRYFERLRQAVASKVFSLVSHPVRMRVANPFLPARLDDELEHLAAEATQHNVALEINGYDVLTYPSLVKHLARACALHHTPISVGSDAHNPRGIAQGHLLSEEIMRSAGLRRVRIWKKMLAEEYTI